jgi:hypothetical protein
MREAIGRLQSARGWDLADGFAVISEAVWWVTMVDATLVRYYPEVYAAVLAQREGARRQAIEDTLAGLRFVRNQMGYKADHADFISARVGRPGAGQRGAGQQGAGRYGTGRYRAGRYRPGSSRAARDAVAAWTWKPLPEPALDTAPPRAQEWEMARYRAYQTQLADRAIGEVFGEAAEFLLRAAESSLTRP